MNIKLDGNRSLPLLSSLNIPNIVPEGGPAPKATPPVKAGDQAPLSFEDCLGFKPLILETGAALLTLASIMEGGAGSGGAATPCLPCCCPITWVHVEFVKSLVFSWNNWSGRRHTAWPPSIGKLFASIDNLTGYFWCVYKCPMSKDCKVNTETLTQTESMLECR